MFSLNSACTGTNSDLSAAATSPPSTASRSCIDDPWGHPIEFIEPPREMTAARIDFAQQARDVHRGLHRPGVRAATVRLSLRHSRVRQERERRMSDVNGKRVPAFGERDRATEADMDTAGGGS
jgi:hypothetical protein